MPNALDQSFMNKVPLVTLYFWIIKILATTVGETGADFLNFNLGFGLTKTSLLAAVILMGFLALQMRQARYVPWIYWMTVVFLSIVGTLITDSLSDTFRVSLYVSSAIFAGGLTITFIAWYRGEHTLSIHDITTPRREAYYWAAILFTFALGTAAGDLVSEKLGLGYILAGVIFGGFIALMAIGFYAKILNPVFAFWSAYVLTRPFGASLGDFLTQAHKDGGLGFSTMPVSGVFLVVIIAMVAYLTVRGADREQVSA
ncbi:COG4705 family protein [Sphingomonas sp. RB1R13]|uniref:COG4705 family protein n=1 Tax=Sphingomonas sp. RB1R13 TaxID=3096159 RepID=UPI002FC5CB11